MALMSRPSLAPCESRIRGALLAALLGSLLLGVLLAWRENLIPDENYSLLAIGNLRRYAERPLYFAYLNVGAWFSTDLHWLRLWSFLPWMVGLMVARRILIRGGFGGAGADLAIASMALNPVLVRYGIRIRYYGTNFLAVMAAIQSLQSLLLPGLSRARRAGHWMLVLLPPLVSPVGLIASLILITVWLRGTRGVAWRRERRWMLSGLVLSSAVALWALLDWTTGAIRARGWRAIVLDLPFSPGYGRPPPSWEALPFQYCKLMGWSFWSPVVPSVIVGLAAMAIVAVATSVWLRRQRDGLREACLGLALVPLGLVLISPVIHVLNVCYYSWVAFPLAAMVAWAVCAIPGVRIRRGVAALLIASLIGSGAIAVLHAGDNLEALERALRRNGITELTVFPGRHSEAVARWCAEKGLMVRIRPCPWRREQLHHDPDWLLATEYQGAGWDGRPPVLDGDYELETRLTSLKDCYHHADRVHGALLRHRRVAR
jgi:hypothetical protein